MNPNHFLHKYENANNIRIIKAELKHKCFLSYKSSGYKTLMFPYQVKKKNPCRNWVQITTEMSAISIDSQVCIRAPEVTLLKKNKYAPISPELTSNHITNAK